MTTEWSEREQDRGVPDGFDTNTKSDKPSWADATRVDHPPMPRMGVMSMGDPPPIARLTSPPAEYEGG